MRPKTIITFLALLAPTPAFCAPTDDAAAVAQRYVGSPYRWGGTTPAGFDCSGLVQFAYGEVGIEMPRTASHQQAMTQAVDPADLRKGDLLFFRLRNGQRLHVGIYLGAGRFVHATSRGKRVSYSDLAIPYWQHHLIRAGRIPLAN